VTGSPPRPAGNATPPDASETRHELRGGEPVVRDRLRTPAARQRDRDQRLALRCSAPPPDVRREPLAGVRRRGRYWEPAAAVVSSHEHQPRSAGPGRQLPV